MSSHLTDSLKKNFAVVETATEYRFKSYELLLQALTHSSYANEAANSDNAVELENNERLEFFGDAVLGLIVAKALMERFPSAAEGRLSRWRSALVSRKTLAEIGEELGFGDILLLGKGESRTGGAKKRSILAGVMESVVGALYLDGGMEKTTEFLLRIYQPYLSELKSGGEKELVHVDQKTHLQERTQSLHKSTPVYRIVDSWGPEHEKIFRVEILINNKVVATGEGRSKKEAEQEAAGFALEELKNEK